MQAQTFDNLCAEHLEEMVRVCGGVEAARCYWDQYVYPLLGDWLRGGLRLDSYVARPFVRRRGKELEDHMRAVSDAAVGLLRLLDEDAYHCLSAPPARGVSISGDAQWSRRGINRQRVADLRKLLGELVFEIDMPQKLPDGTLANAVQWGHYVDQDGRKVYDPPGKKPLERRLDCFLAWTAYAFASAHDLPLPVALSGLLDSVFLVLNLRKKNTDDSDLIRGVDALRGAVARGLIPEDWKERVKASND